MSLNAPVILGEYVPLPAGVVRTTTQTIIGQDLMSPVMSSGQRSGVGVEASGIVAYLNITAAPGGDTLILALDELDPGSGTWFNVGQTTGSTNTGVIKMKVKDAITEKTPTGVLLQIQDKLVRNWRVRVIHSGAGNWTYSLGILLYA